MPIPSAAAKDGAGVRWSLALSYVAIDPAIEKQGASMSTPSNNNFAPPRSVVADVSAQDAGLEKASRISRLGAVIIDGLLFGVPFMPSYWAAFTAMGISATVRPSPWGLWAAAAATGAMFWAAALIALVLIGITTLFVYRNGQTIGKKLLGIKVVRTDGSRAGLARIFWLRYLLNTLLMFIPLLGGIYSLIDALMIFGEARRCCHDYIADTIVVQA
jgi:uncharacterized RDD family membrane protein YckC